MSKKRIVKVYGKNWLAYIGKNHKGYYATYIPSITFLSLQTIRVRGLVSLKIDIRGLVDYNS